jgi:hypothetical protein
MKSIRTSVPSRAEPRTTRFANGGVRITKPGRRLTDQERAEVVKQMHADGRLGREVR